MGELGRSKEDLRGEIRDLCLRLVELEALDREEPSRLSSLDEALEPEAPVRAPRRDERGLGPPPEVSYESTQTIDLGTIFKSDLSTSGSFNIRSGIWATTFGKVLQALPIPALLVNEASIITALNDACRLIDPAYEKFQDGDFRSLFPTLKTAQRAQSLLRQVFSDRKPRSWEGALGGGTGRIWARFTYRPIRIMKERFLLILLEDLTEEKIQAHRNEILRCELENMVEERTAELTRTNERLLAEILDRQQMANALTESEEKYRELAELLPEHVFEVDRRGFFTFSNRSGSETLGYDPEELEGREHMLKVLAPEKHRQAVEDLQRLKSGETLRNVEYTLRRKDGTTLEIVSYIAPIVRDNEFVGARGVAVDISELKQVQERLRNANDELEVRVRQRTAELSRAIHLQNEEIRQRRIVEQELRTEKENLQNILETMEDGVHIVDGLFNIRFINRALEHEFGPVQGQKCHQYFHDRPEPCPECHMEILIDRKSTRFEWHSLKNGKTYEVMDTVIQAPDGSSWKLEILRDISKRKIAEEALRAGEEKYRQVVERANDGIVIIQNGVVKYANPAIARILGCDREVQIGKPFGNYIHGKVLAGVQRRYRERMAGEDVPRVYDTILRHKDGSEVHAEVNAGLIDYLGAPADLVILRDVTERNRIKKELEASELKFRSVVENAKEGIVVIQKGLLQYANPYTLEMLEYSSTELHLRPFLDLVHMEDREASLRRYQSRLAGEELPDGFALRVLQKQGGIRWIEVDSVLMEWEEKPAVLSFWRDVTERKKAEEQLAESEKRYSTLFRNSKDGIYMTTRDGSLVDANPSFLDLFALSPEEARDLDVRDLYVEPADRIRFQKEVEGKKAVSDYELRLKTRNGELIDCLVTSSVRYSKDGAVVGYEGNIRDVTERKILEQQLFQAQKMEAIGTLAGGIAHDFNNMLQIVLGYADMLLMSKGMESPDHRNLEIIRRAVKDGRELVKGLLTFSRQVESELRPIDLNQELKRIRTILRRMIPRMIEIELALAPDLYTVIADPIQVQQVVLNLAVNAHHAMPKGGRLTIETRNVALEGECRRHNREKDSGEFVQLRISDTGCGMVEEVVDRIFEPFYTTKEAGEGTGLGLAIVYGIVKTHGGQIICSSEPGVGTAFTICLPAVHGKSDEYVAASHPERRAIGTEIVLVVDDEELIRDLLGTTLRGSGYRVLTAEDGHKALKIFSDRSEEIGLVVLDLIMPGMGGEQCMEEILKIDPDARVLIISGFWTQGSIETARESGALGFMNKPCDSKEFLRAVRQALDDPRTPGSTVGDVLQFPPGSIESELPHTSTIPDLTDMHLSRQTTRIGGVPVRLRILAIDDREPYLRMLEAGLEQFGQTPLIALSGTEGLRQFQESHVDLVICDLEMPDLDGWKVAERIKEICRERAVSKIPVILLTGQAEKEEIDRKDREKMADCGVDAIVGKPVDIPDLLEIADRLLKHVAEDSGRSSVQAQEPPDE